MHPLIQYEDRTSMRALIAALIPIALIFFSAGCTSPDIGRAPVKSGLSQSGDMSEMEEAWGIRVEGVRLSAADYMLDFRYRIIDPERASSLLNRAEKPYLVDETSGSKLVVPRTRLGPLRQTDVKPDPDRSYFILFGNKDKIVKKGSKVTVVIGAFRAENLVVE